MINSDKLIVTWSSEFTSWKDLAKLCININRPIMDKSGEGKIPSIVNS